jgi:mevalonate kinase
MKQEILNDPAKFFSKLLLFGEYSLLTGSSALTIPLKKYSGQLFNGSLSDPVVSSSNKSLTEFYHYLNDRINKSPAGLDLRLKNFSADLEKGLYLESDIPQAYGVGSSGVVVASVFNKYSGQSGIPDTEDRLQVLKEYFSFMESFFHGASSGLDPLVCYCGKPLLFKQNGIIEFTDIPQNNPGGDLVFFLLDTGISARTGGLVNNFYEMLKDKSFHAIIKNYVNPVTNRCIKFTIHNNTENIKKEFANLSELQLSYFSAMIPLNFQEPWNRGLNSGDYFLKLCGSGGGGFLLGITDDFEKTKRIFPGKCNPIYCL